MLAKRSIEHRCDGTTALVAPNLDLGQDAHCARIGASCCGKTTLLHVLAGGLPLMQARVMLDGVDLYHLRRSTGGAACAICRTSRRRSSRSKSAG